MRSRIHTIEDALVFQLQGLYYSEARIVSEFKNHSHELGSDFVVEKLKSYSASAAEKTLKIERIFNYLMKEPLSRKNNVIDAMIHETHLMLKTTSEPELRNTLVISYLQNINAYKLSSYKTAYLLADELGIDTVCDLLQQILESEYQATENLAEVVYL